jgi:hypothetical protein
MQARCKVPFLVVGSMLASIVVLAGCTKGGQFDPTTLLNNNMFDNKKPLQGQRELVFPSGVPGATTGIPADLYKGYQPPPDQAADNAAAVTPVLPADNAARAEAEKRSKTESANAKAVRARRKPRAEVRVGLAKHPKPTAQSAPQTSQTVWPAPPAAQTQSSSTAWPAPPSTSQAQSAPTNWPAAPPAGSVQQSSQSIWPNPPASSGSTQ